MLLCCSNKTTGPLAAIAIGQLARFSLRRLFESAFPVHKALRGHAFVNQLVVEEERRYAGSIASRGKIEHDCVPCGLPQARSVGQKLFECFNAIQRPVFRTAESHIELPKRMSPRFPPG
jgi:hypothetical protein